MPRGLLLACGNTLRGDDGVGWWIGGEVEQSPPLPDLEVILTQQLLPEHAEQVSCADVVVFVDCSAVTEAGAISVIPISPAEQLPRLLTHQLDPGSLLRLAADLFGRVPQIAVAVTVGGHEFSLGEGLSEAVRASIPKAVEAVQIAFLTSRFKSPREETLL
jgi:hydrogenase maturation protease